MCRGATRGIALYAAYACIDVVEPSRGVHIDVFSVQVELVAYLNRRMHQVLVCIIASIAVVGWNFVLDSGDIQHLFEQFYDCHRFQEFDNAFYIV